MDKKAQEILSQKMLEMKSVTLSQESKSVDKKEITIKHWISKSVIDRGGDSVLPDAFDTTNYEKNRIVLFNHNIYMPIANNLWLQTESDGKLALTHFATTPFADDIYQLNVEKVLNAWSVGFVPKK